MYTLHAALVAAKYVYCNKYYSIGIYMCDEDDHSVFLPRRACLAWLGDSRCMNLTLSPALATTRSNKGRYARNIICIEIATRGKMAAEVGAVILKDSCWTDTRAGTGLSGTRIGILPQSPVNRNK